MVQSAIVLADRRPVALAAVTEIGDDLLELFGRVSDDRSDQAGITRWSRCWHRPRPRPRPRPWRE